MYTITSRAGMTVTMSDADYAACLTEFGQTAVREHILNRAGRVLSHRRTLTAIAAQQLTDDQERQVASLARAYAVQQIINAKIIEMGYGNYLIHAEYGSIMPESWSRIVERARESVVQDIETATATDRDRAYAMRDLGYYSDDDRDWSSRIVAGCDWKITAPDGWGDPKPTTR
jgi:hypothetical protein